MKKRSKARKGGNSRSGKRLHKPVKRRVSSGRSRKGKPARQARQRVAARKRQPRQAMAAAHGQKAADEIPTLEQVTITCANCARPFKVMKLKGLSLEGTICQRCSLGEMEMPESFG